MLLSQRQVARAASRCFLRAASTLEAAEVVVEAKVPTQPKRSPIALGLKPRSSGLPKVRHCAAT